MNLAVKGCALSFLSFLSYVLVDTSNKLLTQDYSTMLIMFCTAVFGVVILFIGCLVSGNIQQLKVNSYWKVSIRGIISLITVFCVIQGFARLELSQAYALVFLSPLLTCLMAHFLLKEDVKAHRWLSCLVGFVGVLIVALPNWSILDPASLFTDTTIDARYWEGVAYITMAALFISIASVYSRFYGQDETSVAFVFYSLLMVSLPVLGCLILWNVSGISVPEIDFLTLKAIPESWLEDSWLFLCSCIFANLGFLLGMFAHRYAQASLIGVFHYTQLIWGAFFGYLFFNDVPTSDIYAGSVIIICSGLMMLYFDNRKAKLQPQQS